VGLESDPAQLEAIQMAKRQKEPFALRPYAVEYFTHLTHRSPVRRGFCMSAESAFVAAGRNLDSGFYIKAVAVKRQSGRVLWTRMKIGNHNICRPGDHPNQPVSLTIDLPGVDQA
jgi:hypothetical protein